ALGEMLRRIQVDEAAVAGEVFRVFQIDVTARRSPATRNQKVLGGIDRNPVQPRVELAIASETTQRPIGPADGLLDDVVALAMILAVPAHAHPHPRLVLQHQQVERALVASLYPSTEFAVRYRLFRDPHISLQTQAGSRTRRPSPG